MEYGVVSGCISMVISVVGKSAVGRDVPLCVRRSSSKRQLISGKINNLRTRNDCSLSALQDLPALSNEVRPELYYKTNIFQVLWGITIVFWKGLPTERQGEMVREAKLQYSATITTPTDILFPTTSTLGEVLSASRPEEREENAKGAAKGETRPGWLPGGVDVEKRQNGNLIKNSIRSQSRANVHFSGAAMIVVV